MKHAPPALEMVWVEVPERALELYEAALESACASVGFFLDEATNTWRVEGVKAAGANEPALANALVLAGALTGFEATLRRAATPAEGWLARTYRSFPEQLIGRRFAVRGTHVTGPLAPGRITLTLDAGVAFGSGEHGSTRGCLRALETVRAPASAHPRSRHRLGHPGDGGGAAVPRARAGHRHRSVVGAACPAQCAGERGWAFGRCSVGGRMEEPVRARGRAL